MGTVRRSAAYSVSPELVSKPLRHIHALINTHRVRQSSHSTRFVRAGWFKAQQKLCKIITRPGITNRSETNIGWIFNYPYAHDNPRKASK